MNCDNQDSAVVPGPLDLLVIQPTPFCNIDCTYCYLPNRQSTKRIQATTLDRLFTQVFDCGIVRGPFTVVWHAGEPLVLPPAFFSEAIELLEKHNRAGIAVQHSFQTNAILIDDAWADFIKERDLRIGVSVDGRHSSTTGFGRAARERARYARVVEGMDRLRKRDIPFHVISVLTRHSLDYPDELFDFYQSQGITRVGFNIEEIEGPNTSSSLTQPDSRATLVSFLSRFYDLAERANPGLYVREFEGMREHCSTVRTNRLTIINRRPWQLSASIATATSARSHPSYWGCRARNTAAFHWKCAYRHTGGCSSLFLSWQRCGTISAPASTAAGQPVPTSITVAAVRR